MEWGNTQIAEQTGQASYSQIQKDSRAEILGCLAVGKIGARPPPEGRLSSSGADQSVETTTVEGHTWKT